MVTEETSMDGELPDHESLEFFDVYNKDEIGIGGIVLELSKKNDKS